MSTVRKFPLMAMHLTLYNGVAKIFQRGGGGGAEETEGRDFVFYIKNCGVFFFFAP